MLSNATEMGGGTVLKACPCIKWSQAQWLDRPEQRVWPQEREDQNRSLAHRQCDQKKIAKCL